MSVNMRIRRLLIQRTLFYKTVCHYGGIKKTRWGGFQHFQAGLLLFALLVFLVQIPAKRNYILGDVGKRSLGLQNNHSKYTREWEEGKVEGHRLLDSHLASLGSLMAVG